MRNTSIATALLFLFSIFLAGCYNTGAPPGEADAALDTFLEETEALSDSNQPEPIVHSGKKDRLPGSLKWASIALYDSGLDFFVDQPGGLESLSLMNDPKPEDDPEEEEPERQAGEVPAERAQPTEPAESGPAGGDEKDTVTAPADDGTAPEPGTLDYIRWKRQQEEQARKEAEARQKQTTTVIIVDESGYTYQREVTIDQ